jgi:hypothetical protein
LIVLGSGQSRHTAKDPLTEELLSYSNTVLPELLTC